MSVRIFVPRDASALAMGAADVAAAIADQLTGRMLDATLVRNGSRGLFWLEPLVEVETPAGRVGYGPVEAADVPSLFAADFLAGGEHPLRLGLVEDIPYLKQQQRLTFARCGITDPLSLADYAAHGGLIGLKKALALSEEAIVKEVTDSGLRGRGGAAFPTGIKWETVRKAAADQKYIVCNADEGDSGTFADRMLMEGDPFVLIEGMIIAGLAVGATKGFIYIRSEYPHAFRQMNRAIAIAVEEGLLGHDILGSGKSFSLETRLGAGAYICGEETSLLESLEGRRGVIRFKPPLPALKGLFGRPTVINNLVSLASVPIILAEGSAYYRDYGMGRSRGTLPFQLAGNIKRGGLIELAFGPTLREIVEEYGGGTRSGRPVRAIQVGGPLGAYWPTSLMDVPLDYEEFIKHDGMIGHGGIVVFDDTVDMAKQAQFAFEFCAHESCGKCTPCRIGSTRGAETVAKVRRGENVEANLELLRDLAVTMRDGSLCALGGLTPMPVVSAIDHFPEDFDGGGSVDRHPPNMPEPHRIAGSPGLAAE
jgi:formate dehydrogenase iron-sulfur subunit